jgi:methionine synthase II (cobalamin-independent)
MEIVMATKIEKELPNFNVFVFSLPRCGSSMMTGIVERLGVNMVYTSEDKEKRQKMKKQYKKKLGDYVPNEHFYEITENQFANWLKVMETPYSGCKVIIPVNGMRWEAVLYQPSKVIMMMRDPEEIRQSQEAFYSRASDSAMLRTLIVTEQLKLEKFKKAHEEYKALKSANKPIPSPKEWYKKEENRDTIPPREMLFDFIQVQYQDVLADPKKEIKRVAEFIEAPNRITRAVNSVKPKCNRFKKEDLTVGI